MSLTKKHHFRNGVSLGIIYVLFGGVYGGYEYVPDSFAVFKPIGKRIVSLYILRNLDLPLRINYLKAIISFKL